MKATETTYRALNARATEYVGALDADDPLVVADMLVDEAVALQDAGRFAEADALLARAEDLLGGAEGVAHGSEHNV